MTAGFSVQTDKRTANNGQDQPNVAQLDLQRPLSKELRDRLITTICSFMERGIADAGVLGTLACNRERALRAKAEKNKRIAERRKRKELRKSRSGSSAPE
ncbi:hypothetical protein [Phyllobacterium sp. SB3]|uniref:hypothetical protein n=1 Tax=Phyllobacterium sp. SB3 TaxID=3156073 RepID=UPI0032AFBC6E